MTEREALKLALEALEKYAHDFGSSDLSVNAMYVARNALAQPDQLFEENERLHVENRRLIDRIETIGVPVGIGGYVTTTSQPEQEPVATETMRQMLEVQGQHGNWNYDSYMHGLYNGMEYMVALAEKREPKFRDAPETWLAKYEVKRDNFNSTEPLTEVTPPQRTDQEQQIETLKRCLFQMQEAAKNLVEQAKSLPPPQRKPLTDEEIMDMYNEPRSDAEMIAFGREVEAKLKDKNTWQDGNCKYCTDGCPACDARRQSNVLL